MRILPSYLIYQTFITILKINILDNLGVIVDFDSGGLYNESIQAELAIKEKLQRLAKIKCLGYTPIICNYWL
jgi:hypothetical protein